VVRDDASDEQKDVIDHLVASKKLELRPIISALLCVGERSLRERDRSVSVAGWEHTAAKCALCQLGGDDQRCQDGHQNDPETDALDD
jgi:hypothetical protein